MAASLTDSAFTEPVMIPPSERFSFTFRAPLGRAAARGVCDLHVLSSAEVPDDRAPRKAVGDWPRQRCLRDRGSARGAPSRGGARSSFGARAPARGMCGSRRLGVRVRLGRPHRAASSRASNGAGARLGRALHRGDGANDRNGASGASRPSHRLLRRRESGDERRCPAAAEM